MKQITVGILAHVDAGKTTLSEAMLYLSGRIKQLGRVDRQNAHLDTHELERKRGITIFSKQAMFSLPGTEVFLLDTPGHMDFSAEMERTLSVLDCAVLVISGTDGVQSHTETILSLLIRYKVPTFIFINKMDVSNIESAVLLEELNAVLDDKCVDCSDLQAAFEGLAMTDERLMEEYLSSQSLKNSSIAAAVAVRSVFPCFFGSALKLDGVEALLSALDEMTVQKGSSENFGAIAYKVSTDGQGARLTHLKITDGVLQVKQQLGEDKINQIRLYSGEKYEAVQQVGAGAICAVTGLLGSAAGMGYGTRRAALDPLIEPVLSYRVQLPIDVDPFFAFGKLSVLEQEDPQLKIIWNSDLREIHLRLMGDIQIEILRTVIEQRFSFPVDFIRGGILYKETIAETTYGAGHFEPLKHYAEVHLRLDPLPRGSGIVLATECSRDVLAENYQNLVLSHLAECVHTGVLTNSPITDISITLMRGSAHVKHTVGGDFREATFRALRAALLKANSLLLEPHYAFKIQLPTEHVGRALSDIGQMAGSYDPPEPSGDMSVITGHFPVALSYNYHTELLHYTKGKGKLSLSLHGYERCHNPEQVIKQVAYDALNDPKNPAFSVFCTHGSGFAVPYDQADKHMHLPVDRPSAKPQQVTIAEPRPRRPASEVSDDELMAIYERTYGKIKRDPLAAFAKRPEPKPQAEYKLKPKAPEQTYMLVDGYNIIFAWDELSDLAQVNIDGARLRLMDILCNYAAYKDYHLILVFDAYKVKGGVGCVESYFNISVVYTKEKETADVYIERVTHKVAKHHKVIVATSDRMEQMITWGHGALHMSARDLKQQVELAEQSIRETLSSM